MYAFGEVMKSQGKVTHVLPFWEMPPGIVWYLVGQKGRDRVVGAIDSSLARQEGSIATAPGSK